MIKIFKKSLFLTAIFLFGSAIFIACNSDSDQEEQSLNSLINTSPMSESALKVVLKPVNQFARTKIVSATKVYAPPTTVCRYGGNVNYMLSQNLVFPEVSSAESFLYDLRDKELLSGETGISYIEAFYEISDLQEDKNFSIEELSLLSDVLPKIVNSYKNLGNENYTGVIINEQLKNEIINVMNFYKTIPTKDNDRYLALINAIQTDLELLVNRDRNQVLTFLKQ